MATLLYHDCRRKPDAISIRASDIGDDNVLDPETPENGVTVL